MLKRFFSLAAVFFLFAFLFQSCASKVYLDAMKAGSELEVQQKYIKAYDEYKKALDEKPDDAKAILKLEEIEKAISEIFNEQGNERFEQGYYRDAKKAFTNALHYQKNNIPAKQSLLKLDAAIKTIKGKYYQAQQLENKNQWVETLQILKDIQTVYHDDSELDSRIQEVINNGGKYFRDLGISTQKKGEYQKGLDYLKTAQQLKDTDQIKQDVIAATKYVKADESYQSALVFYKEKKIEATFDRLIKAREFVPDYKSVNLLYKKLLNTWSNILMENGKQFMDESSFQQAYDTFKKLYSQNPGFLEVKKYYDQSQQILLNKHYSQMALALQADNLSQVVSSGNDIFKLKPGYLDSSEILSQAIFKAFNKFYQRGLHFLITGNYGKAILAFLSAEDQLNESMLTQSSIDEAKKKIIEDTELRIAFWDFILKSKKTGIASHATLRLKENLKAAEKKSSLKNIKLQYNIISEREMAIRGDHNTIDWGLIQSKNCNALISGTIESLSIDTSKTSEWKTRIHKMKKIVDNPDYLATVIKLAKLNNARINKLKGVDIDSRYYKKSDYKKEIEKIETELPGISPKVEADVEEISSYQVEKHIMKALVQIDMNILYQNGTPLWPSKSYQDEFVIEDLVVSPDLQSSIPEEKAGDSLALPSEYEFIKMAINHIIDTKIIPDLTKKFNDYGTRFFNAANKLSPIEEKNLKGSTPFKAAIEDYYKFLLNYKDKGDLDDTPEKVNRYLNSFISDKWLIR